MDGDASVQQPLAQRIDIVDSVRQMAKVPPAGVHLGIPVERQLYFCRFVSRSGQKYQGESARVALLAPALDQTELVAEKVDGFFEIRHAQHGVQVLHGPASCLASRALGSSTPAAANRPASVARVGQPADLEPFGEPRGPATNRLDLRTSPHVERVAS